jgi:hypothetical protein
LFLPLGLRRRFILRVLMLMTLRLFGLLFGSQPSGQQLLAQRHAHGKALDSMKTSGVSYARCEAICIGKIEQSTEHRTERTAALDRYFSEPSDAPFAGLSRPEKGAAHR